MANQIICLSLCALTVVGIGHGRESYQPNETGAAVGAQTYLYVTSMDTDSVYRYSTATGVTTVFIPRRSAGLNQPNASIIGPYDGNLYVGSGFYQGPGQKRGIFRFNPDTGEFIDIFTDASPNNLEKVGGFVFGPDGNLYVANGHEGSTGEIARFDGYTGAFLGDFVPNGDHGMRAPLGIVFGPADRKGNRDLFVSSGFTSDIVRYDGQTGAFIDKFIPAGRGGLSNSLGIVFGPDGHLYVASSGFCWPNTTCGFAGIMRFRGPQERNPGAYIDTFVTPNSGGLKEPDGLIFGPDDNGDGHQDLYVNDMDLVAAYLSKQHASSVRLYDGVTGAFIRTIVPNNVGLDLPFQMTFLETDPMTLEYRGY